MKLTFRTGETIDVKIGTKVYMATYGYRYRPQELIELIATKIGHKWITFKRAWRTYQFDKNAYGKDDYSHNILYPSRERYDERLKVKILLKKINKTLNTGSDKEFTYKQLTKVAETLNIDLTKED